MPFQSPFRALIIRRSAWIYNRVIEIFALLLFHRLECALDILKDYVKCRIDYYMDYKKGYFRLDFLRGAGADLLKLSGRMEPNISPMPGP